MLPICVQSIHVRDLAAAVRFYETALGYAVKARYGDCIVQLATGSTTLILQEIEPGTLPTDARTLLAFQTEDIHASMAAVTAAGGRLLQDQPEPCPVGVVVKFEDASGVMHELLQFSEPRG